MTQPPANGDPTRISTIAAILSLIASALALVSLGGLHVLSPEFDPSRRAVSEYALGHYGWALSLMFLAWGLSAWTLAFAIQSQLKTISGRIGLVFLIVGGIGWAMASVLDVRWPRLHNLSAAIGIPSLPISAMLISVNLGRTRAWSSAKKALLWTANLTWMSLALMAVAILSMSGKPGSRQNLIGWPNRILILAYSLWVVTVAWQAIRARGSTRS
jgi:hypothetical protein